MSADEPPQFARFRDLPTELRLLIWKEALAVDCVLAAVLAEPEIEHLDGTRSTVREARFRMQFVGPSPPHRVGQVCQEAREMMKAVFGPPFRGPRGPKLIVGDEEPAAARSILYGQQEEERGGEVGSGGGRYYWINPATTVFVLHSPRNSARLLNGFPRDELARVQHLAVAGAHWATTTAFNLRLRVACPGLRTLIVDNARLLLDQKIADHLRHLPLDPGTAARYARLSHPTCPWAWDHSARSDEFHERMFVWKDEPVKPRIHLLTNQGSSVGFPPLFKQDKSP